MEETRTVKHIEAMGNIAGHLEDIMELIPILHRMGYNDLHLRYDDCNIWFLEWSASDLDGGAWIRIEDF